MSKELTKVIKDGKDKTCPACKGNLNCSNFHKKDRKFLGREFWCWKCKSKYSYMKYRNSFHLTYTDYKVEGYAITCHYTHPSKDVTQRKSWIKHPVVITPRTFDSMGYAQHDYNSVVRLPVELDFPMTKEQLEDKATLYTTFS